MILIKSSWWLVKKFPGDKLAYGEPQAASMNRNHDTYELKDLEVIKSRGKILLGIEICSIYYTN